MGLNRRRFLELSATASAVAVAGCSSDGDSNGGDDGSSDGSDTNGDGNGGEDGGSDNSDTDGDSNSEDDGSSDGSDTNGDSNGGDDGGSDDSGGDTDEGDTESDEQIQPADITGTAQSSVAELEVVGHEVTAVDLQVQIELELRNAGDDENIALTHHNIESRLFDADGNDILREQAGTRGPESSPSPGESRVVTIYSLPEEGTKPARYEITVNCDGVEYDAFTYCEGE
jgi:hypothetical protein